MATMRCRRPDYRRRRWPRGCAQRPIDEFNPIEHQNPANIAGWKDGWAVRGVYVNNFVFLLTRAEQPLHVEAAKRRPALAASVYGHPSFLVTNSRHER